MSKRSHQSIPDGGSPQPQQDSAYTKRRKLQFGKSSNDRFHSPKSAVDLSMRKLDPSIPLESQRMKTRYKMIEKGKNTVGYDEYNRLVPGNKRRKIVKHPQTPDHTLDIPNRRWQGLVKAWRIGLHQYDPKDLSSDLAIDSKPADSNKIEPTNAKVEGTPKTIQDEELFQASTKGLQIDVSAGGDMDDGGFVDCTNQDGDDIGEWENIEEDNVDFDESDDDLL